MLKQEAQISLNNSSNLQWKGRVETIRAGTGRFEVGKYVVEPPPEITRRQLPVKVATVRIKVDWQKPARFDKFCLAGRSVNVRFIESKSSILGTISRRFPFLGFEADTEAGTPTRN